MAADTRITVYESDITSLGSVMRIMNAAFDPAYGEAWNTAQFTSMLAMPGCVLHIAELDGLPVGFALTRIVVEEAELLLIAVHPDAREQGVGAALLRCVIDLCYKLNVVTVFLEVRSCNTAIALYAAHGFTKVGERPNYYRGVDGQMFHAHSYSLTLKNTA